MINEVSDMKDKVVGSGKAVCVVFPFCIWDMEAIRVNRFRGSGIVYILSVMISVSRTKEEGSFWRFKHFIMIKQQQCCSLASVGVRYCTVNKYVFLTILNKASKCAFSSSYPYISALHHVSLNLTLLMIKHRTMILVLPTRSGHFQ